MTDAIKLLNSAFSGNGKQPKILLLRESHDDLSSVRFIHEHAEEIAARGGMAHFVELPYWFNSLLEGHRHGVISDRELSEYIESLHSAHFVTAAREKSDAIKTLNENGIKTIAIDSRYEDENNELNRWIGRDAYQRAKELSEQFPDSVRHKKFIKKKLREKIPTDSISAWIAYDFLGNEGSAVLTYGGSHMAGECQSHVQGILDDSLENQGAKVTDVQIESSYKTIKETKSYYKLSKENGNVFTSIYRYGPINGIKKYFSRCENSADQRDYVYIYEEGKLLDSEESRVIGNGDPYPYSKYRKAEEIYSPTELNPMISEQHQGNAEEIEVSNLGVLPAPVPHEIPSHRSDLSPTQQR